MFTSPLYGELFLPYLADDLVVQVQASKPSCCRHTLGLAVATLASGTTGAHGHHTGVNETGGQLTAHVQDAADVPDAYTAGYHGDGRPGGWGATLGHGGTLHCGNGNGHNEAKGEEGPHG